jgi:hypothetical protein
VAQVEQLFDQLVLREARATLQLGPDQFPAFRQRMQTLQMVRRRTARERQRLVNELNQLSRGGGPRDDDVLAAKLKGIDEQNEQAVRLVREAHDAVEALLSVEQRVRFRVLEQRLEQRRLELLAQARQQARRGGPPPPP